MLDQATALFGIMRRSAEFQANAFLMFSSISFWLYFVRPQLGLYLVFIGCFYGVYAFARRLAAGGRCNYFPDLNGKVVVITGANSGLGKETTFQVASLGATVVMGCRSKGKADIAVEEIIARIRAFRGSEFAEIVRSRIQVVELDLCSFDSIQDFVTEVEKRVSTVDILFNNAGVMFTPWSPVKPSENSSQLVELQFMSNHLGHFYLTKLLLHLIKKSSGGRIVNVSSVGHVVHNGLKIHKSRDSYNSMVAYGNSKLANILFTKELHKRLSAEPENNVTVYSVHPGVVMTDLFRYIANPRYVSILAPIIGMFAKLPEEGCQTSMYCATHPNAISGEYYSDCKPGWTVPAATDAKLAAELWDMSSEIVITSGMGHNYQPNWFTRR
eukprot:TRINITY_DN1209_c0_g1_i1.p1 TRINITY_DN1209_c0_g1~~TRINITY_DN1209_c0_g1_i1.p1  ORF type:complete len:384 (-),score=82.50 TRINITY_DN1209_c0_g1_i1:613-1764(-)